MIGQFAAAAIRADKAGFDMIELHGAHGYLISSFGSPLANSRSDDYGGTLPNRCRFAIEVATAVRAVWPTHKPLAMRLSCSDWVTLHHSFRIAHLSTAYSHNDALLIYIG